jgi:GAF domain-containing protein
MEQALQTGQATPGDDRGGNLAVPIRVRGQIIGAIDAQRPKGAGDWTPEQAALLKQLAEQLGDALEDARLYQEAQSHAAREQMIGQVASHMRQSLDIDTVLQTAVQEMRDALELAEVEIRMGSGATSGQTGEMADRGERVDGQE